ncbi:isoprenylcysteine carboxylmethyltransferase family protein [Mycobacterium sp. 852002-40037_SCH5390672]|uniref:methyltransferase family protein n=1 Tax=Mycobacterium sp. 852002-40037_SCH5390672 TaxID=1834089 RepID=UPI0008057936|nr:methyltransferase [Mycobacterium sp. 852002-40037_SCH5390672]OBB96774.1 hypothetical protein A5782_03290 [Mycobacterium sp. 852002-40037_SCH5390672]
MVGLALQHDEIVLRLVASVAPMAIVCLFLLWLRPTRRVLCGVILATVWACVTILIVNVVAIAVGWWSFGANGQIAGVPVDLIFGWALLWGTTPSIVASRFPSVRLIPTLIATVITMVTIDALFMGRFEPVVTLHKSWLIGELVNVLVVLLPATTLGIATARDSYLYLRVAIQVVGFTLLMGYVVPTIVFSVDGGGWTSLVHRHFWAWVACGVFVVLGGAIGLQAVAECAISGRGTPVPFDPPKHLVCSGPFAYVSNPMQLGGSAVVFTWGLMIGDGWVLATLLLLFGIVMLMSTLTEHRELTERFGAEFAMYRGQVRAWWVNWRPCCVSVDPDQCAVLTVSPGVISSIVCAFLSRLALGGLRYVVGPERVPVRSGVFIYESLVVRAIGVAALLRALDHANLALALLGWIFKCGPAGLPQWSCRTTITNREEPANESKASYGYSLSP